MIGYIVKKVVGSKNGRETRRLRAHHKQYMGRRIFKVSVLLLWALVRKHPGIRIDERLGADSADGLEQLEQVWLQHQ